MRGGPRHGFAGRCCAAAGVALLVTAGCGTKEDATLSAYVRDVVLTRGPSPFGEKLEGTANLTLSVGAYAPSGVTVTSVTVQLERDNKQILPRTVIETKGTVPVAVAKGSSIVLPYTFTIAQLKDDEPTVLCAGPVTVTGSVTQEGSAGPQRILASPLKVAGCP